MGLFRRTANAAPAPPLIELEPVRETVPAAPMTDLESALARLETAIPETAGLRLPDDTSDVLRKVLDAVDRVGIDPAVG